MATVSDTPDGVWIDGDPFDDVGNGGVYIDPSNLVSGTARGKRAGDGDSGTGDTNISGGGDSGVVGKRRGRQPGTKNKPKSALDVKQQSAGIERLLLSVHTMIAAATKTPELFIEPAEAKLVADAIAAVERHYSFGMSEKSADWANLMMALGTVYGTRLFAINVRLGEERKTAKKGA